MNLESATHEALGRRLPQLRRRIRKPFVWLVPVSLRGLLRPVGAEHAAGPAPGPGHARRDLDAAGRTWPGRDFGVRRPLPAETPLSWGEVWAGLRAGVI